IGGVEDVEPEIQIGAAVGDLVRAVEWSVRDLEVGDDRAALLRQAGLIETDDMLAFETRRVGEGRHDGDRARTSDAHDMNAEAEARVDLVHRVGKRTIERRNATL